jgi:hypothetical protein
LVVSAVAFAAFFTDFLVEFAALSKLFSGSDGVVCANKTQQHVIPRINRISLISVVWRNSYVAASKLAFSASRIQIVLAQRRKMPHF